MTNFKGTREAFAAAMMDMAEERKDIVVISPDSLKAMRAVPFGEKYPDRYLECGIAEQGAVDAAAGLASAGLTPFIGTYCGFLTMRACEQMRTFVGYTNLNVKFIGVNAGLLGGEREGVTHQFYEDLGIISSMPNYTIFTPAILPSAITRSGWPPKPTVLYTSGAAAVVRWMYMTRTPPSRKAVSQFGRTMAQTQSSFPTAMFWTGCWLPQNS